MDEVALRLLLKSHMLQQIWHAFLFMLDCLSDGVRILQDLKTCYNLIRILHFCENFQFRSTSKFVL